ncbi:MAG: hypothetical protein ACLP5H_04850 [Desulfomonilaceae bacterium]
MAKHKKILNAKEVLSDIETGLSDAQLMIKYGLSAKGLHSLQDKLLAVGFLIRTERDLQGNGGFLVREISSHADSGRAVYHETPKHHGVAGPFCAGPNEGPDASLIQPADFDQRLSELASARASVQECPSCGMSKTQEFDECPRCGVVVAKYLEIQSRAYTQRDIDQEAKETSSGIRSGASRVAGISLIGRLSAFWTSPSLKVKTKAIVIAGLAGVLIVGLIISKRNFLQIHPKGHYKPETAAEESVRLVPERIGANPISEKGMEYSEEVLSKMVRTSLIELAHEVGSREENGCMPSYRPKGVPGAILSYPRTGSSDIERPG